MKYFTARMGSTYLPILFHAPTFYPTPTEAARQAASPYHHVYQLSDNSTSYALADNLGLVCDLMKPAAHDLEHACYEFRRAHDTPSLGYHEIRLASGEFSAGWLGITVCSRVSVSTWRELVQRAYSPLEEQLNDPRIYFVDSCAPFLENKEFTQKRECFGDIVVCADNTVHFLSELVETPRPKYTLACFYEEPGGPQLRRVEAARNFGKVCVGAFGGYIESEENLSQEGTCWVGSGARVSGQARVCDSALVKGSASISGNAVIRGHALVAGSAVVSGNAVVTGHAVVDGEAVVRGNAHLQDNVHVTDHATVWGSAILRGDAIALGDDNII